MALGTVQGSTEGDRDILRIPKAGGIKVHTHSHTHHSDLELSSFSS